MRPRSRSFIGALASLVLIVGGFGRAALAADPDPPCHSAVIPVAASHSTDHEHGGHQHGADDHRHGHQATHQDHSPAGDHSGADRTCFKCCGLCTAMGAHTADRDLSDMPLIAAVFYHVGTQSIAGRTVIIDPGIPKHIG